MQIEKSLRSSVEVEFGAQLREEVHDPRLDPRQAVRTAQGSRQDVAFSERHASQLSAQAGVGKLPRWPSGEEFQCGTV